jgi:hypothetical protein
MTEPSAQERVVVVMDRALWCPDPGRNREPILSDGSAVFLSPDGVLLVTFRDGRLISQTRMSKEEACGLADALRAAALRLA